MCIFYRRLLCACLLIVVCSIVSQAQPASVRSLRGLEGVQVKVLMDDMPSLVQQGALAKAQIQTFAELRLRHEGIRVLTEEQSISSPGMPVLYITVKIMQHSKLSERYAYFIEVSLDQMVRIDRQPPTTVPGATWTKAIYGMTGTNDLHKLKDLVGDRLDEFINDFLTANPKK